MPKQSRRKSAPKSRGSRKTAKRRAPPAKRRVRAKVAPVNRYFTAFAPKENLTPEENAYEASLQKELAIAKTAEQLRTVRNFFKGFEAKDGYGLARRNLVRIHPSRLRKLQKYAAQIQRATTKPFVTFTPKSARQRKAAEQRGGILGKGQKKFIIHHGSADTARVKVRYAPDEGDDSDDFGTLELETTVKGGFIYDRIYYFYAKPRTWDDLVNQTQELMSRGMRDGVYKLYSAVYGPIGNLVKRAKLMEELTDYYAQYNTFLRDSLLGWVWFGTSVDAAFRRQNKDSTTAERFKLLRAENRKKEEQKIKRRLGIPQSTKIKRKRK